MTRRIVLAGLCLAIVVSTSLAFAASLSTAGDDLQSGTTAVAACDSTSPKFTHTFTTSGGNVTQVTIGDISATCMGGSLRVAITNSGGASIGSGGPVAVSAGSHNVAISPNPAAGSVAGIHIVVVGP